MRGRALSAADIALLSEAIDDADRWRGALMPDDWEVFDDRIDAMRKALARVVRTRDELSELKAANRRLQRQVEKLL
jgi:hypothetical protein